MHVLDVGYGDAILIEFPDATTMLVDAGGKQAHTYLVEYLQSLNITQIHHAVITHPHANHFKGFFDVLRHIQVDRLFINGDVNAEPGYEELLKEFRKERIPIRILQRGEMVPGLPNGIKMSVLHPAQRIGNPNEDSMVLYLQYRNISILLTADIGPKQQAEILALYPQIKQADCIQVPHHGDYPSDQFIQSFLNKIFVVSTGANSNDLPDEKHLEHLVGKVYRTDIDGTIIIETQGHDVFVKR